MQARRLRGRYPTWDEIADARDELLPGDVEFVMYLPRSGEYVAVHDSTFHLHELRARGLCPVCEDGYTLEEDARSRRVRTCAR